MEHSRAMDIVQALADGIDPLTGEILPAESPYNAPEVIRALFTLMNSTSGASRKATMTPEQRQADNLERGRPRNAGMPWTDALRSTLAERFSAGQPVSALAADFERSRGSILAELKRQGLIEEDESPDAVT